MESEVFLLGHWRNFDELESSLSVEELSAILDASREKEKRGNKFLAAINGVELDEEENAEPVDISSLKNSMQASQEGFGINEGLGFLEL
ncbi:hypothetical protein UFOVP1119_109 [uncultured Caudovirales phage]|uniref:Uncharacterized protein n=1 Tax=uncultured Caudovirales phage TaxID=2100421 RepID=A0A6J5QT67_9CAUD|nr:hypothetical protein UFOVP1119_109 [uncultured Caudovirales phage]CAB4193485.1 hypothetical protein UFOVP1238_83 [uncultured Caudovirales phage]